MPPQPPTTDETIVDDPDIDDDAPTLVFQPTVVSAPPVFLTPDEQLSELAARVRRKTGSTK